MNLVFSLLTPDMDRRSFSCGEAALDAYLHRQAGHDMRRGFATVIAARESSRPEKIIGFYALAAASILLDALPEATARKMPRYPSVPAIRLGRLAVTQERQGRHVGLVWDAMQRCCRTDVTATLPQGAEKSTSHERFGKPYPKGVRHAPYFEVISANHVTADFVAATDMESPEGCATFLSRLRCQGGVWLPLASSRRHPGTAIGLC